MNRFSLLLWLVLGAGPTGARAQQPLDVFLDAADASALDVREARAALAQARAQTDEARARLLPSFVAQAGYQRNEFEAAFMTPTGTRVIQPYDALTASFVLTVPVIDVGAWSAFFQSEALGDAAHAQLENARLEVRAAVVQLWHQLVGARALVRAAERNLATMERNREAAAARVEVGVAAALELARAEAELARARQTLSEAQLAATLAARNLEDLTGLAPSDEAATLDDDLAQEPPLPHFLRQLQALPALRAARRAQDAAALARDTVWTALLPTISAFARESGSNAVGFQGANWSYAIGLTASWQLDALRPAQIGTRQAAAEIAEVRAERVAQQLESAIVQAWHRVQTARESAAAATAALEASRRAAEDARARFETGTATQLDLIQAERDAFAAEIARIQAVATLRVARRLLRLRSGTDGP